MFKRFYRVAGVLFFSMFVLMLSVLGSSNVTVSRAETESAAQPNIIFVVVDALRADHVSSYGYDRQTTPNVDAWIAESGVLFTDVTAASSWTNPANGAMLTSHTPSSIDTVWADTSRRIPEEEVMLAEYLHGAGYYTAGFVSNWWLQARFGYDQGFDTYQSTVGPDSKRAHALNKLAYQWLDQNLTSLNDSEQPLFLFLYYLDPHTWYDPPTPYDTKFDDTYMGTLTAEVFGHGQDVVSGDIAPSARDIEHIIALYDGEISYWDFHLGEMLAYLEDKDVLENSIILVTSDHGQMFGEHRKWVHRNSLYEEVLRIPLLIRYPGTIKAGEVVPTPVHMLDITPTILELLGLAIPAHMDGQSLLPAINGDRVQNERLIFSEMAGEPDPNGDAYWIAPRNNLYSVKTEGWKYIHAQQAPQQDELYFVQPSSIYEQENLATEEDERAAELFTDLQAFFGVPDQFLFLPVVEGK